MPMMDEKKNGALLSLFMKKNMKNSSSYDDMKETNASGLYEKKMKDGAEIEHSQHGLDSAVEEMMSSLEAKNTPAFKTALRSFISMIMHEYKE
jgi:hypothetical protein